MSTRLCVLLFVGLIWTSASGCFKPVPPVVDVPHEPASITPSRDTTDLAKWEGTWECTHNNLFGASYIRIDRSKEGDKLVGTLASREAETVRFFPLSEIEANGNTFQFSWQYPTDPLIVGDLTDQIVERVLDKSKDRPKRTSRLVMTGPDTVTERMLVDGKWKGFEGDYPLYKKR